ncbi:MAG: SagB family peptide dehydrogenase [Candidatus Methylomirabilales bacterium]
MLPDTAPRRSPGQPDPLLAYHEATKHSPESVRRGAHGLDFANQPLPFKIYPTLPPLPLPAPEAVSMPALDALGRLPPAQGGPPDIGALAQILHYSAGIMRTRRGPGWAIQFRAASCTGALYHIDLYVVCGDLDGLPAGVYQYGPQDAALRRLRTGDFRAVLAAATAGEPATRGAAAVLVLATTFWRNAWKYRARAYRHAFWDGGTILANLLAVCAAIGLPARLVLGYRDDPVNALLGLDAAREAAIALVPLGAGAGPPASAPAMAPLDLPTRPLSRFEIDYPEIRAAHRASSLASEADVRAWRGAAVRDGPTPRGTSTALPAPAGPRDGLSAVIARRGSSRAFLQRPIGQDELGTLLHRATRGLPADFLGEPAARCTSLHLIATAVHGLRPGTYAYDPAAHALAPLRGGAFRGEAGFLALEQALAAEAAVNIYCLADLPALLARLGPRAYRAAQLEGGITGGRLYLGAYALGLGATGLTFYDDAVTDFFAPLPPGSGVMFLTAVGHPARRRG